MSILFEALAKICPLDSRDPEIRRAQLPYRFPIDKFGILSVLLILS
jgi:hypothetical protein